MKTTCKCCGHTYDIKDAVIVKANADIVARRRRKNGTKLTSEQARANQLVSTEAKKRNKAESTIVIVNKPGNAQRIAADIANVERWRPFLVGQPVKANKNQGE
jgi:hypothetical protein